MILFWLLFVASVDRYWSAYFDCTEPCTVAFVECCNPCGDVYEACRLECEAARERQIQEYFEGLFLDCATGPGSTWRVCREIAFPVSDPYRMYPDTIQECEDRLPHECRDVDADGDGDLDLYDLAVLTRE